MQGEGEVPGLCDDGSEGDGQGLPFVVGEGANVPEISICWTPFILVAGAFGGMFIVALCRMAMWGDRRRVVSGPEGSSE